MAQLMKQKEVSLAGLSTLTAVSGAFPHGSAPVFLLNRVPRPDLSNLAVFPLQQFSECDWSPVLISFPVHHHGVKCYAHESNSSITTTQPTIGWPPSLCLSL